MRILAVGSGKGGVGKSLISVNLAIALGQAGKRVTLIDLDLGASNAHTVLGMTTFSTGIGTFLRQTASLGEVALATEYENVSFVPGDMEIPGMANLAFYQKQKLIRHIENLQTDFVILDLGAGTHYNVLDFFLLSGRGMIVTTPELPAILNAYLFLKNAVFRILNAFLRL